MEHSFTVKYDKNIIRAALNLYFLRRLGWIVLLFFIVIGPIVFFRDWGANNPLQYLTVVTYLVALFLIGIVYIVRLKQSETTLSKMKNPEVVFTLSNQGVSWRSDLGAAELKWAAFDEVLKFKKFWLLVYARSGYLTLPMNHLTDEIRVMIDSNCGSKRAN